MKEVINPSAVRHTFQTPHATEIPYITSKAVRQVVYLCTALDRPGMKKIDGAYYRGHAQELAKVVTMHYQGTEAGRDHFLAQITSRSESQANFSSLVGTLGIDRDTQQFGVFSKDGAQVVEKDALSNFREKTEILKERSKNKHLVSTRRKNAKKWASQYKEHFEETDSAKGIAGKIAMYRKLFKDKRVPVKSKILLGLAIGYVVCPIDLIPDFIPVLGQLDELIIVPLLLKAAMKYVPENVKNDYRWSPQTPK